MQEARENFQLQTQKPEIKGLGLYRDDRKANGNYYGLVIEGFRVQGLRGQAALLLQP